MPYHQGEDNQKYSIELMIGCDAGGCGWSRVFAAIAYIFFAQNWTAGVSGEVRFISLRTADFLDDRKYYRHDAGWRPV
jgi:hypothetical protein